MLSFEVEELTRLIRDHFPEYINIIPFLINNPQIAHKLLLRTSRKIPKAEKNILNEIALLRNELNLLKEKVEELEGKYKNIIMEEIAFFKRISKDEAKNLIKEYIHQHPGCLTSEIIEKLELDPELVNEVLIELEREGEIEARNPE
ncbi:MAG: hypothetical protein DRJ30_03385 [Candidatus Methanomethylicota archaeon]|nr:MAG: hypothetical protein DRJ30_03385 [Candidatus Verstraetearchaeota archaeon]